MAEPIMGAPTRRDVMKAAAGAAIAAPLLGQAKPKFFTPEEFRLTDELTEIIIPTDSHSPGARAAQCAAYIDFRLAESFEPEPKQLWRDGLKRIDALSQQMHGKLFLEASPEQRIGLMQRISANESDPKLPEEKFFAELKSRTAEAYYTSKIGIHTELEYKGNVPIAEFVGYDAKTGVLK